MKTQSPNHRITKSSNHQTPPASPGRKSNPARAKRINGSPIETPDDWPELPAPSDNRDHDTLIEARSFFRGCYLQQISAAEQQKVYLRDMLEVIRCIEQGKPMPAAADKDHFFTRSFIMKYFGWSGDPLQWPAFLRKLETHQPI